MYDNTELIPLFWHYNDEFEIPEGDARHSWYGSPGQPHAFFEGWEDVLGSSGSSMFSTYDPIVSSHLAVSSPLEITVVSTLDGLDLMVEVQIDSTGFIFTTSNVVHTVITEDNVYEGEPGMARAVLADEPFTLTGPGQSMSFTRSYTVDSGWSAGDLNVVVFVQSNVGDKDVLQAAMDEAGWIGDTLTVSFDCSPESGTLPFSVGQQAMLVNHTPFTRTMAARIDVQLAAGTQFSSWRAGYTNVAGGSSFATNWVQSLPALGTLVGDNIFTLHGADVTPAPYNQPPYALSGDLAVDACTITAMAP